MNHLHRSIITLRGSFSSFVNHFQGTLAELETLWVSDLSLEAVETTPFKQAQNKLGHEVDVVVFDLTETLAVNALGAISGCIKGGGALCLILPEEYDYYKSSFFYKRLLKILAKHQLTIKELYDSKSLLTELAPLFSKPALPKQIIKATAEQQQTIDAIRKVVAGHRNRPLVITSNRGRGKSSAIGMAVNELLSERPMKIIVCAPTKAMIAPLFQFAGHHQSLRFIAPDKLAQELPEAGLLIIDEAGAIPVPILEMLLTNYSRLVFSTTLHGYEGSGRGFAIRFHQHLNEKKPDWKALELQTPIRWGANDPLEALINDLLLLDSEPCESLTVSTLINHDLQYQLIPPEQLLEDELLLRQLFGLLVIAHYQTRPSDLIHILDDEKISIHALLKDNNIVAAAIVSHEGGLDHALAQAIYRGERRPTGHLVPQILLSQMGLLEASELSTDRIMRIATHQEHRRQQLASKLLFEVASQSKADYLSTSFGLSGQLLAFWDQAGYQPVYLGLKREASSGYHSALMLNSLTKQGAVLEQAALKTFAKNFVAQLGDTLSEYNPNLAYHLLSGSNHTETNLSRQQISDINRFACGQCGLDSALAALQHWLPNALVCNKQNNNNEIRLLVMRILQHKSWTDCCKALGISGKQAAQQKLQQTVSVLARQLPEMDLSKDGLTRR